MARLNTLLVLLLFACLSVYGQQQDVDFHLSNQFLQGKTVLKVKRDFYDPYVWVLAKNNEVYRVNSVTMAVDDYTATFATYNNLQFIDIAGRSRDTVFIATNSTNVVQYKNGSMRLIGTADGIPGTVNSVGIAERIQYQFPRLAPALMIASDKGFRLYDTDAEKIYNKANNGDSKIYEATYRTEMYKDSSDLTSDFVTGDTIDYQPVTFLPASNGAINVEYLWEGGKQFGYNINTAVSVYESIDLYNPVYTNLFWGNSHGMSQNYSNDSYYSIFSPSGHYLDGINVNKITTIYGLTSFGSGLYYDVNYLIKQNILVGTDKGFYFSSSIYTSSQNPLRKFSLFHFDELGNIKVNDVCVNTSATNAPICEDGVWLGCDNGLYLIKPDYGKYLSNQKFHAASFTGLSDTVSQTKICAGTSVTAAISPGEYKGNAMQWYKDGIELAGQSHYSLVINKSGDYYAVLYDPCGDIHVESNHLKVQVISSPVFSFDYPDKLQFCDNTPVTLKTTNNPGYQYRWYTNGVLNGGTDYNYTVNENGKYKVEVSACNNSWVPSKEIEVDLINLPEPVISADKSKYCAEDVAALTVNVPADAGYTINWYKDGSLIAADQDKTTVSANVDGNYSVTIESTIANCTKVSNVLPVTFIAAPVFTSRFPDTWVSCSGAPVPLNVVTDRPCSYRWYTDGVLNGNTTANISVIKSGKYKVEASACEGSWVSSNEIFVQLIDIPAPLIQADKTSYCIGDNATLRIAAQVDPNYTINWYKDNVIIPANTDQTSINTNETGRYSVNIVSKIPNSDGSTCMETSAVAAITFNPVPTVSIQKTVRTTLCDGQTVDLKVSYDNGTVKWSTGESNDQISVSTSGSYKATITTAAGCSQDASADVQFFPNPVLNIPNNTVCVPSHKTVTLTAPAGMTTYTWNGQNGSATYVVDHPQTVTLNVTDANGCQATQDIQVADECPDIDIPNTFTPNGDGINDKWDIIGLEYDATALVRIFTRNGQQIFESKGYSNPWDGNSKGKQLPAGVYYYVITIKNNSHTLSGSVTIIR